MSARRVLVVDDDDSIRMVAEMALETVAGWTVLTADGGLVALDIAARELPEAILLDVMMPGVDGPTTFRRLQADPVTRDIPVILVTAKIGVGDRNLWPELAVAGVIPKPFDPMTLGADVSRLLGWVD